MAGTIEKPVEKPIEKPIEKIGIIGTGVIGTGWAARILASGKKVIAFDLAPGFAQKLQDKISAQWPTLVKFGVHQDASLDNLLIAGSLQEAVGAADFVQESAPEDLQVKQTLHRQIEQATGVDTIVASSSSGLLPSDIQSVYQNPERLLIGHPFNPVYLLPLVEVVPGKHTSAANIQSAKFYYESLGMQPLVLAREIEGYLSDRLQEALWREALHLVNDGVATTEQLDDAIIYGPGLRWAIMGTCLTFHLAGGEGGMEHMLRQFGPALKLPWTHLVAPELNDQLINRMVEGTKDQAAGSSISELESLRDNCLIEIMKALKKFEVGAGKLQNHL